MKFILRLWALFLCLSFSVKAATVTFAVTNYLNQPDTNAIKIYPVASYVNADGSVQTVGLPSFVYPTNPPGIGSIVLAPGNYLATNSTIITQYSGPGKFGSNQGILFAVPNNNQTYNVGLLAISGYNVFNYNGIGGSATNAFSVGAGTNVVIQTNGSTYTVQVPAQNFLTNGLTGPGVTNGFAGTNWVGSNFLLITGTNGLAGTNWVGANYLLITGTNGLAGTNWTGANFLLIAGTNGLAGTNWVGANFLLATGTNGLAGTNWVGANFLLASILPGLTNGFVGVGITNQFAPTNWVGQNFILLSQGNGLTNGLAGTNWAGANFVLLSQIQAITNGFATTNWTGLNFALVTYVQAQTNAIGQQSGLMAYQPTNLWTTYNGFTNVNVITSNGIVAQIVSASGGIPLLNGLGTNTAITNGKYAQFTNLQAVTIAPIGTNPVYVILTNNVAIGQGNSFPATGTQSIYATNAFIIGINNTIQSFPNAGQSYLDVILGGSNNLNQSAAYGFLGNGTLNEMDSYPFETIVNGYHNYVHSQFSVIVNGTNNQTDQIGLGATSDFSFIGSGANNHLTAGSRFGFVGTGQNLQMLLPTPFSSLLSGSNNIIGKNIGPNSFDFIPYGYNNLIDIATVQSAAIGANITLTNSHTTVLNDGTPVSTTTNNLAIFWFTNGVAINTNSAAGNALAVNGNLGAAGINFAGTQYIIGSSNYLGITNGVGQGTYQFFSVPGLYTNLNNPVWTIGISVGTWFLYSNSIAWYNSTSLIGPYSPVSTQPGPNPVVLQGGQIFMNGWQYIGYFTSTNAGISTNGLASIAYVQAATNGFTGASVTNGLAGTNWVGANYSLITGTNGLASTNWVKANFATFANVLTNAWIGTNAPVMYTSQSNIVVTGAGTSGANGTYNQIAPTIWTNASGDAYYLTNQIGSGVYVIYNNSGSPIYNGLTVGPAITWNVLAGGVAPAPIVIWGVTLDATASGIDIENLRSQNAYIQNMYGTAAIATSATNAAIGGNIVTTNMVWGLNTWAINPTTGNDASPIGGIVYKSLNGACSAHNNSTQKYFILASGMISNNAVAIPDNTAIIGQGRYLTTLTNTANVTIVLDYDTVGNNVSFSSLAIKNQGFAARNTDPITGGITNAAFNDVLVLNAAAFDFLVAGTGNGWYYCNFNNVDSFSGDDTYLGVESSTFKNCNAQGNYISPGGSPGQILNGDNDVIINCKFAQYGVQNAAPIGSTWAVINDDSSVNSTMEIDNSTLIIGGTNFFTYFPTIGVSTLIGSGYSYYCTNANNNIFTNALPVISGNGLLITNLPPSGIAGNATAHIPVAVTVGSSAFHFTNSTPVWLECYFSDSAAYSVSKNGVNVYQSLAGDDYFLLPPTNQCVITYASTTPTFYTNAW